VTEDNRQLARTQADIQIWSTACFALIVLMAACALGAWQIITTPTANLPEAVVSARTPIFFLISFAGIVSGIGTLHSYIKMKQCRSAMG